MSKEPKKSLPRFALDNDDCQRYRLAYKGGRDFVNVYLKKYSAREDAADFAERRDITYCPAFAGSAVDEIINAIFSRLPDVIRKTESTSFPTVIKGQKGGVDLRGMTMDNFIGSELLPELATMRYVGVFVDMPASVPATKIDRSIHPYFYIYRREDIISWEPGDIGTIHEFKRLLLRRNKYQFDDTLHLISGIDDEYILLEVLDNGSIQASEVDIAGKKIGDVRILNIPKIPFVMFKLRHSLLKDAADYQIALLNLESTDIDFARKANFPLYTEQITVFDALPNVEPEEQDAALYPAEPVPEGEVHVPHPAEAKAEVGPSHGRRYARGLDRPEFIHPSPQPLSIAMEKEDQMKRDLRIMVHLAVASLGTKSVSAESKEVDRQGLENGLAKIALVLEEGERKLLEIWNSYESIESDVFVTYPRNFDLRTEADRRTEAKEMIELSHEVTSDTFKRVILKRIAKTLAAGETDEIMKKIADEIEKAPTLTSDAKTILEDHKAGFVTTGTASVARGYKPDEAEKAKAEHAERLKMINESQGKVGGEARGVDDNQTDQQSGDDEKDGKPKRGEAKL